MISALEVMLPTQVYRPLYGFAFASYKGLLRLLYFRHVIYYWVEQDSVNYRKARAVRRVMPHSLVGSSGLEATYDAAMNLANNHIPGSFVECGVAQGGCSALMAMVAAEYDNGRRMWLFDSFEGLPSPTDQDYDKPGKATGAHLRPLARGSCLGTQYQVEQLLFLKFGLDRRNVLLVKGWFQDTLPASKERIGPISLLRIDGDWYESTKCCLENLYDQVVPGGWVIIDDYETCFGAEKAVDEFLAQRGLIVLMSSDGRGGVQFQKPA